MGKDFIVLLASAFESHFLLLSIGFPLGILLGFGLIKLFDIAMGLDLAAGFEFAAMGCQEIFRLPV